MMFLSHCFFNIPWALANSASGIQQMSTANKVSESFIEKNRNFITHLLMIILRAAPDVSGITAQY
jgi:hypothetical protein